MFSTLDNNFNVKRSTPDRLHIFSEQNKFNILTDQFNKIQSSKTFDG